MKKLKIGKPKEKLNSISNRLIEPMQNKICKLFYIRDEEDRTILFNQMFDFIYEDIHELIHEIGYDITCKL